MKKQIYLYVIAIAIAGLLISSATGLSTQMKSTKENNFLKDNIVKETNEIEDIEEKDQFEEQRSYILKKVMEQLELPDSHFEIADFVAEKDLTSRMGTVRVELEAEETISVEKQVTDIETTPFKEFVRTRQPYDYYATHPAFAIEPSGQNMIMGYNVHFYNWSSFEGEDYLLWEGNNDYGSNISWGDGMLFVDNSTGTPVPIDYDYPSADYWGLNGSNHVWYATYMSPSTMDNGADINILKVEGDPYDMLENSEGWYWNYSESGFDFKFAEMACDDRFGNPSWDFGYIALVISDTDYNGSVVDNGPTWFQATNETSGGMSCFTVVYGSQSASMMADRAGDYYVGTWDGYFGGDPRRGQVFTAQTIVGDEGGGAIWRYDDSTLNMQYPAIAAYNHLYPTAWEFQEEGNTSTDLMIGYFDEFSKPDPWAHIGSAGWYIPAGGRIRYPEIAHFEGSTFVMTCLSESDDAPGEGELLFAITYNGGVSWDGLYLWSPEGQDVEFEYRCNELSDFGLYSVWEFDNSQGGDSIITIMYGGRYVTLEGDCTYKEFGTEVDPVWVEIYNKNISSDRGKMSFYATTVGNHYSRRIIPGLELWGDGRDFRIIGTDHINQLNITDHTWTDDGEYFDEVNVVDLEFDIYYLDLVDFPMYLADDNDPTYTPNQLCGPAAIQMNIDYMRWNSTLDPDEAPTWCENNSHNQSNLFNTYAVGTYMNADEMDTALDALKGDHYNFGVYHNIDGMDMLGDMCYWIDYEPPHDEGFPAHVPGAIPLYGDYSNWASVRGIHTDADPYPAGGSFTVHGLWVNDPMPTDYLYDAESVIGENTYKMASEWLSTYYLPLDVSGDPYDTEYVAVCEPPEDAESSVELVETTQYWDTVFPDPQGGGGFLGQIFDNIIIYAATQGARDRVCPYDERFADVFEQSYAGRPMLVKNLLVGDEKHDFYIVPYDNEPTKFMKKGDHSQGIEEKTLVAVIVNAETGQFQEASWVDAPVKYPVISEAEARQIVDGILLDMGINPDDIPDRAVHMDLVYRGGYSQFSPEWRARVLGMEFFI